jgi:hypothetical protein
MQVLLVHVGSKFPEHAYICLNQLRFWDKKINVHFLINKDSDCDLQRLQGFNVTHSYVDDLSIKYQDGCIGYPAPDFWNVTLKRLYYLEAFIKQENLIDTIHFENDVMIYTDVLKTCKRFPELFNRMAMTFGTKHHTMTGFSYIKNADAIENMMDYIDGLLGFKSEDLIRVHGMDMVNEMTLMKIYADWGGDDYLAQLPSLPTDKHAMELGLFDPAAYGQYLGGTPFKPGEPWAEERHFIGKAILDKKIEVKWMEGWDVSFPSVRETDDRPGKYWLHNLHVHSKQLNKFTSY